jgi:hypothetical protein
VTQRAELERLTSNRAYSAGYCWLAKDQLPAAVPASLQSKLVSALLIWERTASGNTALICNGIRLDAKADALDQEPFGLMIYPSGASTGGIIAHHGDWPGRTIPLTSEVRRS